MDTSFYVKRDFSLTSPPIVIEWDMKNISVVAVGGNSLIRGPHASFDSQRKTVQETCKNIADLVKKGFEIVITHGNGPQVGLELLRSYLTRNILPEIPLDICNAITQAEIGYMLQQALGNVFLERGIEKEIVTVITQVVVDKDDPAFSEPTKPIGPFYTKSEALELKRKRGWVVMEDAGRGYRRVVPSPKPLEIVESSEIRRLVSSGVVVIGVGGGGIPVIREGNKLRGIAAVIDKDRASALLASQIGAEVLLISTAVEYVYINYNRPSQKPLRVIKIKEAERLLKQGQFPPGSMGPKIISAIEFLKRGGREVIITDPKNLRRAVEGKTGTRIIP